MRKSRKKNENKKTNKQDELETKAKHSSKHLNETEMSLYEQQRLANIKRNKACLRALGLETSQPLVRKKRKRKQASSSRKKAVAPRRKSRRLQQKPPHATAAPQKPPRLRTTAGLIVPEWATLLLEGQSARRKRQVRMNWEWDPAKTHQHLLVSSNRSRVAVIGCAGYGASIARPKNGKTNATKIQIKNSKHTHLQFRVAVVKEGVGGFAVGIAGAGFRKPFKSIGRHNLGWMLHSSGSVWHNGKEREGWCKPFGEGDIIGVELRNGCLSFSINNETQGVAFRQIHRAFGFSPAVQPYMGGVAECLS